MLFATLWLLWMIIGVIKAKKSSEELAEAAAKGVGVIKLTGPLWKNWQKLQQNVQYNSQYNRKQL